MTPEQFTYWLKGFLEISEATTLTEKQTQIIHDHLKTVFNKVTPNYTDSTTLITVEGLQPVFKPKHLKTLPALIC